MPELPEVETMRRGVVRVVGSRISGVQRPRSKLRSILLTPRLDQFRRRAVGAVIRRTDRLGKRLLLWIEGDQAIVFEPRMTGLVLLADPPSQDHLRLRVDLQEGPASALWYWDRRGLGSVRLLHRCEVQQQLGPPRLGPDALALDAAGLRMQLAHRRVPIKVALLDQTALAGIGNLYASEILHVACIHPALPCCRLTRTRWQALATSMRAVLEEAIRYEGSTLSDGTYRTALNQTGGYQNHHRVYARAGQLCLTCRQRHIERMVQAQRSTFYCPACQKR